MSAVVIAKGRGGVWAARADAIAACGEDMAARKKKKKKKDVGAHTGGVVEDSSTPRLRSYEAFSLADGHGGGRKGGPMSVRLAVAVIVQVANG